MRVEELDYDLPEELIAQTPLVDRSESRLLHLDRSTGFIEHRRFQSILEIFQPGDLLVMNDTRVTARRLLGHRETGGKVEALLLEPIGNGSFAALIKPASRIKLGERLIFGPDLSGFLESRQGEGRCKLRFESHDLDKSLKMFGEVPLPPYVRTKLTDEDRYQTVYAHSPGSAAAPTAGLHFTRELLEQLTNRGVLTARVTLDVSTDTFRPIKMSNVADHQMHGEHCSVPIETAEAIRVCKGRIIAVGTTTVRTLESRSLGKRLVEPGSSSTSLFICPGYEFKVVDGMLTNFHMPRTTMLLMIAAMANMNSIKLAYTEAVTNRYRFLSFGDSMLIL